MKTIIFLFLCISASLVPGNVQSKELLGNNSFVGHQAPPIELYDISGERFSLAANKGKVVLLQFWASWCPPCIKDIPSLDKLQQTYTKEGLAVVIISTGPDSDIIKDIVKEQEISLKVILDTTTEVKDKYGVFALPTSFLVGRKGHILEQYIGEKNWMSQESRKFIEKILQKK